MSGLRRFATVTLAGCCLVGLLAVLSLPSLRGQEFVPQPFPPTAEPPKRPEAGTQYSAIKLNEKSEYRQYINVARDCIKDGTWNDAVTALQLILDNEKDYYVKVRDENPATGEAVERWTSVKYEANKLLGMMPQAGLDVYEVRVGAKAKQMLDQAKQDGSIELLAEVAQRFLHTRVGPEANDLLATYFLDRGQFFMAALRFERLLQLAGKDRVGDLTLVKAVLAYRRAGEVKKADALWGELLPRLQPGGGLKIGDQLVRLDAIERLLADSPRPLTANPNDWPLVRGNEANTAQASGTPPLLDETLWSRPTICDKDEISDDGGYKARPRLAAAVQDVRDNHKSVPVMPGFFPIAADGKMIYRTYAGVSAVFLKDYVEDGEVLAKAGSIAWKSIPYVGALAQSLEDKNYGPTLEQWLDTQYGNIPVVKDTLMYENSLVGTLSCDLRNVYAVDDLAIPVPPALVQQYFFYNQAGLPPTLKQRVLGNTLQAYDINTGKMLWMLGVDSKNAALNAEFQESHFLGPPLTVGGKLYALNEKNNGELRLVCLDPATGALLPPVQDLGTVDQTSRFYYDPNRRVNAVHLGYGEGILVCPTNAGEVLGVDLLSRTLAWSYPYREEGTSEDAPNVNAINPFGGRVAIKPLSLTTSTWKVAPPAIQDGKVVFTAPDAHSLHCVNLRDGTQRWKRRKSEHDLFLAGVWGGKVVVVGSNSCYALNLADGYPLWSVTTGDRPAGQGVASQNVYYLPLQGGEVLAIDLERGTVKARNRPGRDAAQKPGNLLFYEGVVLSQTPDAVVAYPQLASKLELARLDLKKEPASLEKLTQLAELELADGQVHKAVQGLRLVYQKDPAGELKGRVRQKLYEAMTDLFNVDFNTASNQYMDEYRALLKVPGDPVAQQEREAKFLQLLGRGREVQGDLVAAFKAYREFGALPLYQKEGVPAADDPTRRIPTQVWLRARISSMFARATPQQRRPLEEQIAAEWRRVRDGKQANDIRGFVNMFDVPFPVGREARFHLADTIIVNNDRGSFLEAELSLEQLRTGALRDDPEVGGKALAGLARLAVRRGTAKSMQLAAAYYRKLAKDFPGVTVENGKTGADLLNELATDKRFLPFLDEAASRWPAGPIKARELPMGAVPADLRSFVFRPRGDLTPATAQLRLLLDPGNRGNPELKLVDLAGNKELWSENLGLVQNNYMYFQYLYNQVQNNNNLLANADFRYFHVKGHLAVLQVGTMAYCLDLENPRILWRRDLLDEDLTKQGVTPQNVMPDADGRLVMMVYNRAARTTQRVRIGEVGAVQANYVCLLKQNTLEVLDPLSGKVLWDMDNVPNTTVAFGDDEHLYLVDVSGGTATGGRAVRVADGTPVPVKDFAFHYRNRVHSYGRQLLAAAPVQDGLVLRLYDIPAGKDVWSRTFPRNSTVLKTVDPRLTGVIDPDGKVTVLDVPGDKVLLEASAVQYRVTKDDVQKLHEPLLLADDDHFYLALNQPVSAQEVAGGQVLNNFYSGIHCAPVNGWVSALHRRPGSRKIAGEEVVWKAGDMAWHSYRPVTNQLIVLEQFDELPVLLFTARYNQLIQNQQFRGATPVSATQCIDKANGKMVYSPLNPQPYNGAAPSFNTLQVDRKAGTISLVSLSRVLQFFVDDGRTKSAALGGKVVDGTHETAAAPVLDPNGALMPGFRPPGVPQVINGRILRGGLQVQPAAPRVIIERQQVEQPRK